VKERLTIVQMLPELNVGGVESGVMDSARGYVARGHTSIVISNGGRLVERLAREGTIHHALPVHKKSLSTALGLVPKVARILKASKADIVHARSRVPAWIGHYAARRAGVPFVTTVHGFYSPHFFSRIMVRGERVIAVSRPVAEYATASLNADPARIRVIHRGIEPERYADAPDATRVAALRKELGVPEGHAVVAIIGRITRLKGHPVFLEAMARVIGQLPDVCALVVGAAPPRKAPYLDELKALATKLGLGERAVFAGSRPDVPEVLHACDVVVNASTQPESFGRTLIEAMAAGRPVVATAHGGALDIVADGVCGRLVPPERPDALADALLGILRSPDRGREMGQAGRARVLEHFTVDRMVDETLAVYRELTDGAPPPEGMGA
jgi:glycosyltransferase involved in cell wall biosynthesis